jgi:hypothetical protein
MRFWKVPSACWMASALPGRITTSNLAPLGVSYVPMNWRSVSTLESAAGTRRVNATAAWSSDISTLVRREFERRWAFA